MMTPRQRAVLFLALGSVGGLVTSVAAYQWLQEMVEESRAEQAAEHRTAPTAVAATSLPGGTVLAEDSLRIVSLPVDTLPEGHFSSTDSLTGRVLLADLAQHEVLLESKLAPATVTTGGIAAITRPDKRAVAVKVDEVVSAWGVIKPGNRVDVIATLRQPGDGGEPVTKVVVENVRVLATGSDVLGVPQPDKAAKEHDTGSGAPSVMTLEVTPTEAAKLALASAEGKVQLALRNPQTTGTVETSGITITSLLGPQHSPSVPLHAPSANALRTPPSADRSQPVQAHAANPPPRPPRDSVEVFKGMTRTEVQF